MADQRTHALRAHWRTRYALRCLHCYAHYIPPRICRAAVPRRAITHAGAALLLLHVLGAGVDARTPYR